MRSKSWLVLLFLVLGIACSQQAGREGDASSVHKMTALDRAAVGRGVSYTAKKVDPQELKTNIVSRREHAWTVFSELTSLVQTSHVKTPIPLWQTSYDQIEFARIFKTLLAELSPADIQARKPFEAARIEAVLDQAANDPSFGVWDSQALSQRLVELEALKNPGGEVAATGRTLFSPEFILHFLKHYGKVDGCDAKFLSQFTPTTMPTDPANFAPCFDAEFPENAVMLKTVWVRAGNPIQVFKSDGPAMTQLLQKGDWVMASTVPFDSVPSSEIYTVDTTDSVEFKLVGMHVATKEVREWVWSTFWWAPDATADFGADRPASVGAQNSAWQHYKMCTTVDFEEGDRDPAKHYQTSAPTLAKSIRAIQGQLGNATWCANPNLEGSFPKTNCIGCHQHAPGNMVMVTEKQRETFPADFAMSFERFQQSITEALPPVK